MPRESRSKPARKAAVAPMAAICAIAMSTKITSRGDHVDAEVGMDAGQDQAHEQRRPQQRKQVGEHQRSTMTLPRRLRQRRHVGLHAADVGLGSGTAELGVDTATFRPPPRRAEPPASGRSTARRGRSPARGRPSSRAPAGARCAGDGGMPGRSSIVPSCVSPNRLKKYRSRCGRRRTGPPSGASAWPASGPAPAPDG